MTPVAPLNKEELEQRLKDLLFNEPYPLDKILALLTSQIREARIDAIKSYKKVLKAEATLDNKGNRKDG